MRTASIHHGEEGELRTKEYWAGKLFTTGGKLFGTLWKASCRGSLFAGLFVLSGCCSKGTSNPALAPTRSAVMRVALAMEEAGDAPQIGGYNLKGFRIYPTTLTPHPPYYDTVLSVENLTVRRHYVDYFGSVGRSEAIQLGIVEFYRPIQSITRHFEEHGTFPFRGVHMETSQHAGMEKDK